MMWGWHGWSAQQRWNAEIGAQAFAALIAQRCEWSHTFDPSNPHCGLQQTLDNNDRSSHDIEQIEQFDAAGNGGEGAYLVVGKCTVADGAVSFTTCARNASQSPAAFFLHWPVVGKSH
jgi:hypothetical protein